SGARPIASSRLPVTLLTSVTPWSTATRPQLAPSSRNANARPHRSANEPWRPRATSVAPTRVSPGARDACSNVESNSRSWTSDGKRGALEQHRVGGEAHLRPAPQFEAGAVAAFKHGGAGQHLDPVAVMDGVLARRQLEELAGGVELDAAVDLQARRGGTGAAAV